MIPNMFLRAKARAALKPLFPIILLCALIANLPSLIAQTVGILAGSDPMMFLMSQATTEAELLALMSDSTAILTAFEGYLNPSRMAALSLSVLSFLVSPVLLLGLTNAILKALRGEDVEVATVFSRLNIFFKSILQNLYITLKVLLWSIPGGAVMVGGAVIAILTEQMWLMSLYFVGLVLMIVQMIRALLHYALSTFFLADDPSLGVCASVKRSIAMMKNRKLALLSLTFSVYFWLIVAGLAESLASGLFGTVIGSTVYMALQLVVSIYMNACHGAFYEFCRQTEPKDA